MNSSDEAAYDSQGVKKREEEDLVVPVRVCTTEVL